MQRILVPIDFSPSSEKAVLTAECWAKKFGATIELFYVEEAYSNQGIDSEYLFGTGEDSILRQLISDHEKQLKAIAEKIDSEVEVKTDLRIGRVINTIEDKLDEGDYSMIVMGTKGMNEWDRLLIGSNAEKMLRRTHIPLLIVPKEAVTPVNISSIVLATNSSEKREGFIHQVKKLQAAFSAEIKLLRVVTASNFYPTYEARKLLNNYAEKNELKNYSSHIYNAHNIEEGIISFAEENNIQLITMASHYGTMFSTLFGSISQGVVQTSNIPVFTMNIP